jgi:hypothetical protein
MQNVVPRQETDMRALVRSMLAGADHDDPFHLSQLPKASTTTQKEALGHETDVGAPLRLGLFGSMLSGVDHDTPFQVAT